jgi:TonB family protein
MTIFLLKLSLCWAFFALLYALLLRKETFFRANRVYLLGTAALGILLAALPADQLPVPVEESGLPVFALPEFSVGVQQVEAVASTWQDLDFLWMVYWLGFSLMLARVLWGLYKIVQMAINGRSQQLPDGCLLIETNEAKVPFSFFKWVFVPEGSMDFSPSGEEAFTPPTQLSSAVNGTNSMLPTTLMLAHERAHAHGWHSADVLFAELLCIVFWFHPVAHWYRKALRTVHEYLADAAASRQADRKQYGLLLIGQSQSGMSIAFANHFFQSPLKQRLIMLTKKASAPVRAIKFGFVAPLAILFAVLFRQAPAIAQVVDEKHLEFVRELESKGWMRQDTVVTFDPNTYQETVKIVRNSVAPEVDGTGNLVYQYTEVQPQFPGGQEALNKYLTDHLKYPEAAKQAGAEGIATVRFVVNQDGTISKARAIASSGFNMREDMLAESERVVSSMPNWIPAKHKGKTVSCIMNIPLNFRLDSKPVEAASVLISAGKTTLMDPAFPGDPFKFLRENIKYPATAKAAKAEGMVIVKFVVKEDGSLTGIEQANPDKPLHPDLVIEAIRVVSAMPNWKPGMKEGKVVQMEYMLPIKFKLDKKSPE